MTNILFVISATVCIYYFIKFVSVTAGNEMTTPMPIGHIFDVGFSNTYVTTSAIAYQVYFWFNLIGGI